MIKFIQFYGHSLLNSNTGKRNYSSVEVIVGKFLKNLVNYRLLLIISMYVISLIFLLLSYINDYHNNNFVIYGITLTFIASLLQEPSKNLFIIFLLFVSSFSTSFFLSFFKDLDTIILTTPFVLIAYAYIPCFPLFVILLLAIGDVLSLFKYWSLENLIDRENIIRNTYSFFFVYSFLSITSLEIIRRFTKRFTSTYQKLEENEKLAINYFSPFPYIFLVACVMSFTNDFMKRRSICEDVEYFYFEGSPPISLFTANNYDIKHLSIFLAVIITINLTILFLSTKFTQPLKQEDTLHKDSSQKQNVEDSEIG